MSESKRDIGRERGGGGRAREGEGGELGRERGREREGGAKEMGREVGGEQERAGGSMREG